MLDAFACEETVLSMRHVRSQSWSIGWGGLAYIYIYICQKHLDIFCCLMDEPLINFFNDLFVFLFRFAFTFYLRSPFSVVLHLCSFLCFYALFTVLFTLVLCMFFLFFFMIVSFCYGVDVLFNIMQQRK